MLKGTVSATQHSSTVWLVNSYLLAAMQWLQERAAKVKVAVAKE